MRVLYIIIRRLTMLTVTQSGHLKLTITYCTQLNPVVKLLVNLESG